MLTGQAFKCLPNVPRAYFPIPETWTLGRQRHGAISLADTRGITRVHATAWPWLGRS